MDKPMSKLTFMLASSLLSPKIKKTSKQPLLRLQDGSSYYHSMPPYAPLLQERGLMTEVLNQHHHCLLRDLLLKRSLTVS
jgi:hypothetical protein